MIYICYLYRLF